MTNANTPIKVALCWHMHQPQYRVGFDGEYREPWTYLHALKDYVDMAGHLEAHPNARAVVNFSPILLEQIADYATAVNNALERGTPIHDPVLRALQEPPRDTSLETRRSLLNACMRINQQRVVDRFPAFARLHRLGSACLEDGNYGYLNLEFYSDLAVWYHLGWFGETLRRSDVRIKRLEEKGSGFNARERETLLELVAETVSGLLPRYRRLADEGRIELATSPYAHPILPLMIDWESAREAMPSVTLPTGSGYPMGRERARWHLSEALRVFERHLGRRPAGCWPSEGAVSQEALALIDEQSFSWTASGQGVLAASVPEGSEVAQWQHRPLGVDGAQLRCFFRDDGLSDRIGFEYASWHAEDAVSDFILHLKQIGASHDNVNQRVVSIIMDGENAWEYYPENGWHFLDALYRRLVEDPEIEMTTFSQCLTEIDGCATLPRIAAGSWVYGSFSTWIGDAQKNHGWELLAQAADAAQECLAGDGLTARERARIEYQLAICEGSDWCWWFGEYNAEGPVRAFDALYRAQLSALYVALGREPPLALRTAFAHGAGQPAAGGTMRRGA